MGKPCVICVVRPICIEPCDEFIEYLNINVGWRSGTLSIKEIAILERKGRIVLLDRDTTWQWSEIARFVRGLRYKKDHEKSM